MSLSEYASLIATALSVPALVLIGLVLRRFGPVALASLPRAEKTASEWLIIGVTLTLLGLFLNTAWWAVHWTANEVTGHQALGAWMYAYGSVVNVITRQSCTIAAVWCHLVAYQAFGYADAPDPDKWLFANLVMGAALAASLLYAFA